MAICRTHVERILAAPAAVSPLIGGFIGAIFAFAAFMKSGDPGETIETLNFLAEAAQIDLGDHGSVHVLQILVVFEFNTSYTAKCVSSS